MALDSLIANATGRAQTAAAAGQQAQLAKKAGGALSIDKAKAAAQQFEAFFVGQMMEYMTEGLKADSTFGGGYAENTWRSMMNQEYGKVIAKSGRLGITDQVVKGMIQAQETRTQAAQAPLAAGDAGSSDAAPLPLSMQAQIAAAAGLGRSKDVTA